MRLATFPALRGGAAELFWDSITSRLKGKIILACASIVFTQNEKQKFTACSAIGLAFGQADRRISSVPVGLGEFSVCIGWQQKRVR